MKKSTLLSAILLCTVWIAYGQWTYTSLSEPKSDMGSVSLGTKVYFAGGYNGLTAFLWSKAMMLRPALGFSWHFICCTAMASLCGLRHKNIFCRRLDFEAGEVFNTVDILILKRGNGRGTLSLPRFNLAAVSYGSKVFFAGGVSISIHTFSLVDIYDVETGKWTTTISRKTGVEWPVQL